MSRQARITFPGAWYHVINRGILHTNIYYTQKYKAHFKKLLGEMVEKYKVEVHAYCLMDNHFHLIVHTPDGNISEAIHFLESAFVNRINAEFEREGPFFKGRFLGIVIDSDAYLTHLSRYIHLNPKKAKMVDCPEIYRWSSYQEYLGIRTAPKWLTTNTLMSYFNNDTDELKMYTDDKEILDFANFYSQKDIPLIMGGEEFRQNIKKKIKESNPNSDALELPIFRDRYSFEQIEDVVCKVLGTTKELIHKINHNERNIPRLFFIYLAKEKSGQDNGEIIKYLNVDSRSLASNSVRRLEEYMMEDQSIKHQLEICICELSHLKPINTNEIVVLIGE